MILSAPSSNPLLADYVHKDAIGKAAALVGLGFIVGEVLSMGVLFRITADLSPYTSFMIVSITGAVFSTLFICLVKEPKLRPSENEGIEEVVAETDLDQAPPVNSIRDLSSGFEARTDQPLLIREERSEADGPCEPRQSPPATSTNSSESDNNTSMLSEEEFKSLSFC